MSNRLARSQSPYLLQHADNPVDWYAWGDEAFEAAVRTDKPIFLSIGYSTCHWCHVMAHESFEDAEVAALMNDAFINVKLDREERPDVDTVYMNVCQLLTQHGGWPLTIIMTPDKRPFFAGTYIPKNTRQGRLGMLDLIPRVQDYWQNQREEILASAGEVTAAVQAHMTQDFSGGGLNAETLRQAYTELAQRFDAVNGGFGGAPKFPTPHTLLLLLRYVRRTGLDHALHMAETTLKAMRRGGVYDHVGFGFHRYSTDARWLLPHFEKMLYDQAMLVRAYTEAYQTTQNPQYAQTVREVLTYVLRDMTDPTGGFYAAEDADSEGVEGKFYVWTLDELTDHLGPEQAAQVAEVFQLKPEGNFAEEATGHMTGDNIPHLLQDQAPAWWEAVRARLFDIREQRIHPHKDDKILTDWNGLMITALAQAGQVLNEPAYIAAAERAAAFVLSELRTPEGRLLHRYRAGEAGLMAHLDDYAFMVQGLLALYEATFKPAYLASALELNQVMLDHFWDAEQGGFFFTPDDGEDLLVRPKESYDGAVPSGNAVAMTNLLKLGRLTGQTELEDRAEAASRAFARVINRMASAHTQWMAALDFALGPTFEITLAGDPESPSMQAMIQTLRSRYLPNKVVLLRPPDGHPWTEALSTFSPFTTAQQPTNATATAYVCQNYVCNRPTTDPEEMLDQLAVS